MQTDTLPCALLSSSSSFFFCDRSSLRHNIYIKKHKQEENKLTSVGDRCLSSKETLFFMSIFLFILFLGRFFVVCNNLFLLDPLCSINTRNQREANENKSRENFRVRPATIKHAPRLTTAETRTKTYVLFGFFVRNHIYS